MRIMVIDDEVLIVRSLTRLLKQHEVVGVHCGQDALALLEDDNAFDGILCDVKMPDTNGAELAILIAERWKHLGPRICMCSGSAGQLGDFPRLEKPFTRDALEAQVRLWED